MSTGSLIGAAIAKAFAGGLALLLADQAGLLATTSGGLSSALDVAAAGVIKAAPGRLAKIIVITAPSAGNLVVNDLAADSGAGAANTIFQAAFGSLTEGQVITLDWPCETGIVVSSVGTGGVYAVSYS